MVLPLLMAGLGTGLSMYGAQRKKREMSNVSNEYMAELQRIMAQRKLMNADAQKGFNQLSDEHNKDLSGAIGNYLGADRNLGADTYTPAATATVNALRQAAPDQSDYNTQNGAAQSAMAAQGSHAASRLATTIAAGKASDAHRRLGLARENALSPYTMGEQRRATQHERLLQALQLRAAGIGDQWSQQQMGLQNAMNAAGRTGDHGIMWGTLLQQLGGSSMGGYTGQAPAAGQGDPGQTPYNLDNGGWAGYDYPQQSPDGGMYA